MSFLNDLFIWISFEILMFKGAFRKSCSATSMFMLLAWHSINGWDQRPDRIPCYHYHPLSRFTPTLSISSSSWIFHTLAWHDGLRDDPLLQFDHGGNIIDSEWKMVVYYQFQTCHFFRFELLFCCNIIQCISIEINDISKQKLRIRIWKFFCNKK